MIDAYAQISFDLFTANIGVEGIYFYGCIFGVFINQFDVNYKNIGRFDGNPPRFKLGYFSWGIQDGMGGDDTIRYENQYWSNFSTGFGFGFPRQTGNVPTSLPLPLPADIRTFPLTATDGDTATVKGNYADQLYFKLLAGQSCNVSINYYVLLRYAEVLQPSITNEALFLV